MTEKQCKVKDISYARCKTGPRFYKNILGSSTSPTPNMSPWGSMAPVMHVFIACLYFYCMLMVLNFRRSSDSYCQPGPQSFAMIVTSFIIVLFISAHVRYMVVIAPMILRCIFSNSLPSLLWHWVVPAVSPPGMPFVLEEECQPCSYMIVALTSTRPLRNSVTRCILTFRQGRFTVEEAIGFSNVTKASLQPPQATDYFGHVVAVTTYGLSFPPVDAPPMVSYYRTHFSRFQFTDVYTYHVEKHALHKWVGPG